MTRLASRRYWERTRESRRAEQRANAKRYRDAHPERARAAARRAREANLEQRLVADRARNRERRLAGLESRDLRVARQDASKGAARNNRRWSPAEDAAALDMRTAGATFLEIAVQLGRTYYAVHERLRKIAA